MGYRSSYTLPLFYHGVFEGFHFFDSRQLAAFTPELISHELTMMHALLGSMQVAGISILRNLVAFHHEFLDGSGYPRGAVQADIPIEARIVTVADIFAALTSRRIYKEAWDIDRAMATLDQMAAKVDADCVTALRAVKDEVVRIIERFGEKAEETA